MKTVNTKSNILGSQAARMSSLLTVGLAVLGPGMKLPKAWASSASAVTSISDVAWSNTIDWSASGSEFDIMSPSFNVPVTAGLSFTVSTDSPGVMERRDQDSGWMGCMDAGEALLWLHDDFNPVADAIQVSFSTPVLAVGTKIQNDAYGQYSGWIQAFDINDNLIGAFSAGADACFCANGGAAFIGLQTDSALISYIRLGVTDSQSFAIGSLNILAGEQEGLLPGQPVPSPSPVPEAAPVAAAGVFGLLLVRWVFFRKSEEPVV